MCRAIADTRDREIWSSIAARLVAVILNRFPYNNGHLLVMPLLHKGKLDELVADEQQETLETITRFVGLLSEALNSEGFNVGLNLGRVAGAGVPGHLHWHIVPRWSGDTNFMPVLSNVGVVSQSLDALWEVLTEKLRAR